MKFKERQRIAIKKTKQVALKRVSISECGK